jgi:hypothetical protein
MGTAVACAEIFVVPARQTTQPGGVGSLEWILGLLESLNIRALVSTCVKVSLGGSVPLGPCS